jgi:hypothetical protein
VVVQQNGARLLVAVSQIRLAPGAALGTIIPISMFLLDSMPSFTRSKPHSSRLSGDPVTKRVTS